MTSQKRNCLSNQCPLYHWMPILSTQRERPVKGGIYKSCAQYTRTNPVCVCEFLLHKIIFTLWIHHSTKENYVFHTNKKRVTELTPWIAHWKGQLLTHFQSIFVDAFIFVIYYYPFPWLQHKICLCWHLVLFFFLLVVSLVTKTTIPFFYIICSALKFYVRIKEL